MNDLKIIEHQNQRVLTTQQLAESYGTDNRRISENFNANKKRYVHGKHYILLEGADLKAFGDQYGNSVSVNRVSKLYLWTEKGTWLHAKSLNTEKAWEAYETLVDDYFVKREFLTQLNGLSPEVRALINIELKQKQIEQTLLQTKQIVINQDKEIKDLKSGLVDVDEPLRKQFNSAVRKYSKEAEIGFDVAYKNVYNLVNSKYHVDIYRRLENQKAKGKNVTKIDILEQLNLLVPAIRIAKTLKGKVGEENVFV